MVLRKLKKKDADFMLEWMHDKNVISELNANFSEKTIDDCIAFIENSNISDEDIHFAIVDANDEYMGTVSLKHVDMISKNAEFAITVRSSAMGRGFSSFGMSEILKYGIEILHLTDIYWCVAKTNTRAIRFYDKNNYVRTTSVPSVILSHYDSELLEKLIWYKYN